VFHIWGSEPSSIISLVAFACYCWKTFGVHCNGKKKRQSTFVFLEQHPKTATTAATIFTEAITTDIAGNSPDIATMKITISEKPRFPDRLSVILGGKHQDHSKLNLNPFCGKIFKARSDID
jgi:hypothetical protein